MRAFIKHHVQQQEPRPEEDVQDAEPAVHKLIRNQTCLMCLDAGPALGIACG